MRTYQPEAISNRLIRHGKYLIPWSAFLPDLHKVNAPREFISLPSPSKPSPEESQHPDHLMEQATTESGNTLQPVEVGFNAGYPESQFEVTHPSRSEWVALAPESPCSQWLYSLPHGHCIGRNGCLMTHQGRAVLETAFFGKHGMLGFVRFLPIDPRYWRHRKRGNLTARSKLPAPQYLRGRAFSLNNCSCNNFFHWMTEIAPRIGAANLLGLEVDHYIVDHQSGYQREILNRLGIPESKWVQPHCNLHLVADEMLWCKEPTDLLLKWFTSTVQESMKNSAKPGLTSAPHRKVYVSRKKAQHRKLNNEAEIEEELLSRGFEVHCFEDIPFAEQLRLASESTHFVSVHGAALANTVFMPRGGRVIEIFPERRPNILLYPSFSRRFGHHHSVVIAKCTKARQKLNVDCELLLQAVDRIPSGLNAIAQAG